MVFSLFPEAVIFCVYRMGRGEHTKILYAMPSPRGISRKEKSDAMSTLGICR